MRVKVVSDEATKSKATVFCKATPPKQQLAYTMKAPPKSYVSCWATCLVVRRSDRVSKPKKLN
jgi:hypothetical protein